MTSQSAFVETCVWAFVLSDRCIVLRLAIGHWSLQQFQGNVAQPPLTTKDEIHRFLEAREVQQVAVCKALAEDQLHG